MARAGLSATRATEVIDFLASRGTTPYSLSELSKELGINVASCHAILQGLSKSGHLSRHPKHKTYTLGPALVAIGQVALRNHELIARAEAAAAELSRNEGLEVLLSTRAGDTVLGLAHCQLDRISKSWLRTGQRMPLRVPFGATFVAWEAEAEIENWIRRGMPEIIPPAQAAELRALLALIRQRGYQISLKPDARAELAPRPEDWEPGLYLRHAAKRLQQVQENFSLLFFDPLTANDHESYAVDFMTVPLFDPHDKALYAMTLYNFPPEMTARAIHACLSKLLAVCASIGREL